MNCHDVFVHVFSQYKMELLYNSKIDRSIRKLDGEMNGVW